MPMFLTIGRANSSARVAITACFVESGWVYNAKRGCYPQNGILSGFSISFLIFFPLFLVFHIGAVMGAFVCL
jgi:hypothetical protein